jgi:FkbM family methyltransferase
MLKSIQILLKAPYNKTHLIFALVRFIHWKIIKLFKIKDLKYQLWGDRKIYLNYNSFQCMWIAYNYIVDWEEFNLIKDYLNTNDNVADVGSNMGYYTIWMSKFIKEDGMIHSFEPDNVNFDKLTKNCNLNNLTNVKLNKLALNDKDGVLFFTTSLDGENHISLTESETTVKINSQKLDTYCEQNRIVNFSYIKVDIEGFEYYFLKGADSLLKTKSIEIIQLEINKHVKNSATNVVDLLGLINDYGYEICKYDQVKKQLIKENYSETRENYFAVSNLEFANKKLAANTSKLAQF